LVEVSFREWLKRQRNARGLTQEQLARQLGCATITLRKIESEERRPSAQIVERLAEVFSISPNEQTAFMRFARGDWRSAPSEVIEDAPWHSSTTSHRSKLPASTTSLIGREQELALLSEYLSNPSIRLINLIGPPGIGKTRLSLEVARAALQSFPGGAFFVALALLEDPNLVAPTIMQALGFIKTENQRSLERLKDGIGQKQMLIALDNVEHLIEGIATLVSELLSVCPHLKILTTSREALRVPGEWLYAVPALNIPTVTQLQTMDIEEISKFTALTLFSERARAVQSDFVLDADNIQTVVAICLQLDGLPLAIELIAARIRLMSPQALLSKLNDQFVLSADGMRAVSARQKTLHNAIGWSYNLLSPEEQKLFACLSVFSGGFTLDAAEAIFSRMVTNKSVSELIASLLDKSLLQRRIDERRETRFHMLVIIRQFALDRLQHMGQEAEVRSWHLAYFLEIAEQADKQIHGPDQVAWMNRLEMDHDNFRTALEWCLTRQETELSLRLFGALSWFRRLRAFFDEVHSGFGRIRALPDVANFPLAYAKVLNAMGRTAWLQSDYSYAQVLLNESRELWRTLDAEGERGLAECLDFLGMVARWNGADNQLAESLFKQGMELYRKSGDLWGLAESSFHFGIVVLDRKDETLALSLFEKSLSLFRQLGDLWGIARVSQKIGEQFLTQGKPEKASLYFEEHLRLDEEIQFKLGIAIGWLSLGDSYRHQDDYDQAEQFYEKALAVSRNHGLKDEECGALYALGVVALGRSDYLLAEQHFKNYYNSRRSIHEIWSAIDFLGGLAAVAAGLDQFERAAKLHGAAQALFNSFDLPDLPYDRVESDSLIQIAREQLGEERFGALAAEGHAMTREQAVAYALEK